MNDVAHYSSVQELMNSIIFLAKSTSNHPHRLLEFSLYAYLR
jgi:hypothetical protein